MNTRERSAERSILIVDDDSSIRRSLSEALLDEATSVLTAESGEHALSSMGSTGPDLVLADLRMPGMDGIELLQVVKQRMPSVDVVIMTAHDDLPTVATAIREGARDYLIKPLDLHAVRALVRRIFDDRVVRNRLEAGHELGTRPPAEGEIIGRDPRLVEIFKVVGRAAATPTTVLIRGESGTGKELIARAIHGGSPHRAEAFVPVNCSAIPESLLESELFGHVRGAFTGATRDRGGRFAQADRGTLFLDEIGDTTVEFQGALLRVLQEREYYPVGADRPTQSSARVIAATHRDLERMVENGGFREDLYYRLRVVELVLPPLRERVGDLPELVDHFLRMASLALGRPKPALAAEAHEKLLAHGWPGNIRELKNCIDRAVATVRAEVIRAQDLDLAPRRAHNRTANMSLSEMERIHVARVLEMTGGQKARAARILEISRPRLDRIIKKYALEALMTKHRGDAPSEGA